MEDVEACMEHFYGFEATMELGGAVEKWLIRGRKQDLSELQKAGVLKVKRGS